MLKNIPEDINAEVLLDHMPKGSCKVTFQGLHKRNSYKDVADLEQQHDSTLRIALGRNSLYNTLPEYMFHPIDRFSNLPRLEEKERFKEEYEAQEKEKERAYKMFYPHDLYLLWLRMSIREKMRPYVESNKVLIDIIGDRLTESQRNNRFIRQITPLLPACKNIRGNRTLLTLLLRKVFMEEGLHIRMHCMKSELRDTEPRYCDSVGGILNDCYAGNVYEEDVMTYDIGYWQDEVCDEHFLQFVDEVEQLRLFVQDYFLAVGHILRFNIVKDEDILRLSDDSHYYYLNYNTNL